MNLTTIDVPVAEAKARLAEYEGVVRAERSAEDEAIAAGYRAAARGLPVIQLSQVIAAGGFFDDGLPRLAVARADARQCFVHIMGWGEGRSVLVYSDERQADNRGALVGRHTVRVAVPPPTHRRRWRAHTVVPLVPPRHRPRPNRLARCHLLWEVDSWTPAPPVDPALIRHIRGDLWAVLAVWDLTELERAVLAQRLPS